MHTVHYTTLIETYACACVENRKHKHSHKKKKKKIVTEVEFDEMVRVLLKILNSTHGGEEF